MAKRWTHDELVARARELAARVPIEAAADAFVASMKSGPLEYQPALIAALLAHRIPVHSFDASKYKTACAECGGEKRGAFEERDYASGDVLPGSLSQAVRYLEHFTSLPPVAPTSADREALSAILALVGTLPAEAGEGKLNAAISRAKILRGNSYRRRFVLETLGYASVLDTPEHHGLLDAWVPFPQRDDRPSTRVEIDAPLGFWRAAHGVNASAVARLFPGVEVSPQSAPRESVAPTAKRKPKPRRETSLEHGDVIEIARGGRKEPLYVVVTAIHSDKGGRYPIVSLLAPGPDPMRAEITPHRIAISRMLAPIDPKQGYARIGNRKNSPKAGGPYELQRYVEDAVRSLERWHRSG